MGDYNAGKVAERLSNSDGYPKVVSFLSYHKD